MLYFRVAVNFELKGVKIFYDLTEEYSAVAVVGIKKSKVEDDESEDLENKKENVRIAAAGTY